MVYVFELPMRDGNETILYAKCVREMVFELPMRDGNSILALTKSIMSGFLNFL